MLETILFAIVLGFAPSVIWLCFWLLEDPHPESLRALLRAFIAGVISVPVAILLQFGALWAFGYNPLTDSLSSIRASDVAIVILLWALIEECLKFGFCGFLALSRKDDDEPIDPFIYMVTAALGFAAIENTLFVLSPLIAHNTITAISSANMRFIGATLLHIASSGLIGVALGFAFFKANSNKIVYAVCGLSAAIALHTGFNLLIIKYESYTIGIFAAVWLVIIGLIITIEKLKS